MLYFLLQSQTEAPELPTEKNDEFNLNDYGQVIKGPNSVKPDDTTNDSDKPNGPTEPTEPVEPTEGTEAGANAAEALMDTTDRAEVNEAASEEAKGPPESEVDSTDALDDSLRIDEASSPESNEPNETKGEPEKPEVDPDAEIQGSQDTASQDLNDLNDLNEPVQNESSQDIFEDGDDAALIEAARQVCFCFVWESFAVDC